MAAAIWSCPTRQMLEYPCRYLPALLPQPRLAAASTTGRSGARCSGAGASTSSAWQPRFATCGSPPPVQRVRAPGAGGRRCIRTAAASASTRSCSACHSDQALRLLADADRDERRVLGSVRYQPNRSGAAYRRAASCRARAKPGRHGTTLRRKARPARAPVSVSYWLNRAAAVAVHNASDRDAQPVSPAAAGHRAGALRVQPPDVRRARPARASKSWQASRAAVRTWFCGAWTGDGFHEAGLRSGLAVADGTRRASAMAGRRHSGPATARAGASA